jgi:CRP-like cAMP-binding protein
MTKNLVQQLFHGPPKVPRAVRELLQIQRDLPSYVPATRRWRRQTPKYVKGVSNGNYFRIKIPPKKKILPAVPKLPPTNPMPKPLSPPPKPLIASPDSPIQFKSYPRRLLGWLKSNRAVLVLNFGSMCTLTGFMRSDVLELRSLALTGNCMFILYVLQQNPILWPSIIWSGMFGTVNAWKIVEILHERTAEVHMNEDEQKLFVSHFMSHGVTPKQYERITKKATKLSLKKGDVLVRSGDKLKKIYLVAEGATRGLVLGRFVTAASTNPETKGDRKAGGDSGAWIGEMAFLDSLWELEQGKTSESSKKVVEGAIYTIVCDEDCTVLTWSHEDMAELMGSSNDLRSALTRAMTSALVGKVVNLTVSRTQQGLPHWSTWLSDWGSNDGAKVSLRSESQPRLAEDTSSKRSPGPTPA